VKALTDTTCNVTTYDEFMNAAQTDLNSAMALMKTLVRRQRQTSQHVASMNPGIRYRIEQCLTVILAGLDQHDGLSGKEMQSLQRELRMLLKADHLQVAREEIAKAEDVLSYMLRPTIEQCLDLWFGKAEATDKEIWDRFGADVALATRGHYDLWALNVEYPRLLVALVIMLDQFPRNMYRRHTSDVRRRCALPVFGEAQPQGRRGPKTAPDRAGIPVPRPDPFGIV
jgi:hypothetical protein